MDYTYAAQTGNHTTLYGVRFFDLAQTLDCGQAFRWRQTGADEFCGVAHGRRLEISRAGDEIILRDVSTQEFEEIWRQYFDFSRDYGELRARLKKFGGADLNAALEFSPGLRLLRQDPWETLVSFILSQNSNIPRIKKMIETLCEKFGKKLPGGGHAFPAPEALAALNSEALAPVKCGYRAGYILDAARRAASGEFDPSALENLPSDELCRELQKIRGVGPKVAECVLLYGFSRVERYPVDVWIKRAMAAFFPLGFPPQIKNCAGIAQQFLFHYARIGGKISKANAPARKAP